MLHYNMVVDVLLKFLHNNGRVARYFHVKTLGPSLLIIQGHQNANISFSTINMLIYIRIISCTNRIKTKWVNIVFCYVVHEKVMMKEKNIQNFHKACQVMHDTYFYFMGDLEDDDDKESGNFNFNQLFANAPWISVPFGEI